MKTKKFNPNGKCFDHGGWDKRVYGEKCPACDGRVGRKRKGQNDE